MSDSNKTESKPAASASDSWMKWVALSTTVLAVSAAFSTMKGGGYSTQTQLASVNAANKWSYFQSKSAKETVYKADSVLLGAIAANATGESGRNAATAALEKFEKEVARYEVEKVEIQKEAQAFDNLAKYNQKRGGYFGLAAMFLQIAIMLAAIATLLKKRTAWLLGLILGAVGIGLLVFAWPLYEKLVGEPPATVKAAK